MSDAMAPGAPSRTRLMITKMVLENFKSYGGVREIGPLHKRFSSIVGPNGSGKSNVIDAMLFVFGKRAKKLRLNKVSELIHCSEKFPNLESARVSVHFADIVDQSDNDDAFEIVPGSELVVTRTAYSNNQSKYQLNDSLSNFTEVTQLLRQRGIDLDNNRFLILQGEVEQIAMMKPKAQTEHDEGLLEYLEDIIGSNRYVEQTEEAAKEVETSSEQRLEKLNRLKVTEKEKENLEEARQEAEACLEKEREVRQKFNKLYQLSVHEAETNVTKVESKHAELSERRAYEEKKHTEHEKQLVEMQSAFDSDNAEHDALNAELKRAQDEFAAFERKDIAYREKMKHQKATVKKLEATIKRESKKAAELQAVSEEREAALPALRAAVEARHSEQRACEQQLEEVHASLEGETATLREQLEAKQTDLAPVRQQLAAAQATVAATDTEIQLLESGVTSAQQQLNKVRARLTAVDEEQQAKRTALATHRDEINVALKRKEEARAELDHLNSDEGQRSEAMKRAMAAVEEARASQQSLASRGDTLQRILAAARPGGALSDAGVCGRLGDLGAIAPEYDVAISTACSMLDHIVVESVAGGQQCIEFLKRERLGRASFIVLSEVEQHRARMERTPSLPDGAPRLFDLIQPRGSGGSARDYRCAFYLALRDTLVAKDLDVAVRIAYEGDRCAWRVVTLTGQLIDKAGTMAGGGKDVKRGGMWTGTATSQADTSVSGASEADVKKLVAAQDATSSALRECRERRQALETELRTLEGQSRKLETRITQLDMEVTAADSSRTELHAREAELIPQCNLSADSKRRLAELKTEVAVQRTRLGEVQGIANKLETHVKAIKKALVEVGGSKLKASQAAVDKAIISVDESSEAVGQAEVDAKSAQKNAKKAEAVHLKAEKELESLRADQEVTAAEFKQLEEDAFSVMKAFEAAKVRSEAKQAELQAKEEEFETLKKTADKIKTVELDIINQLEQYTRVVSENRAKAAHWQQKLEENQAAHLQDQRDAAELEAAGGDPEPPEKRSEPEAEHDESSKATPAAPEELPKLSESELAQCDKEQLKYEIALLEEARDAMRLNANMGAIAEHRAKERECERRLAELEVATEQRNGARGRFEELRRKRLEEFMAGFGLITLKLKEMYQMITLGGDAELELVDSLDPFSEGIVFSVRPPKKSWKNIANLSGGEKTLSSLALVFALHHFKPTPLYVMDEIDAALDHKNVSIIANYIKQRTRDAQFVIISLRNNMFELADRLTGVYKPTYCTSTVTISPREFAKVLKDHNRLEIAEP